MRVIRHWFLAFALLVSGMSVAAQTLDPLWDGPERLSSYDGIVADRSITVDSRGRSHAFWIEDRFFEGIYRLNYARYGGKSWTPAIKVLEFTDTFAGVLTTVDAVVDSADVIRLIWHGRAGAIQYSYVAVDRAPSPTAWSEPVAIPAQALESKLLVDVQGALVVVYTPVTNFDTPDKNGVFAVRSTDEGATWSEPVRIDSGLPAEFQVQDIDADYDGSSAIHAVWTYVSNSGYEVRTIKYARSIDAGKTWSAPLVLDEATSQNPYQIRLAAPELKALGANAHIIYAAGGPSGVGRRHLRSTNSGATWTEPETIWPGLEGAAGTDSAYFDSRGRLHLLAQVRMPQGIYHSVFENGAWAEPSLIYLIAEDAQDVIGDRVHAQYFEAAVTEDDRVSLLVETCARGCQDNSTWPQNPIMFAFNSVAAPGPVSDFTSVSSATFVLGQPLAPAAIAAGFGQALHGGTVAASDVPLPTSLGGIAVEVADAQNRTLEAGLQFVSPQQLNYVVPEDARPGLARVRVRRGGDLIAAGTMTIHDVAPAVFTANGQGTGPAAATWLFVAKGGARSSGLTFDPQTRKAIPLTFDPNAGDLYLTIYGTGFRGFKQSAQARVGSRIAPILSIGAQGQFDGLDQINIGPLPSELQAGGELEVVITVDGQQSNRSLIAIAKRP